MSDLLSDPSSLRREHVGSERVLSAARAVLWHEWVFAAGALAAALTVIGPWLLDRSSERSDTGPDVHAPIVAPVFVAPVDGGAPRVALERK